MLHEHSTTYNVEFKSGGLDLASAAQRCQLSPPYLSTLISSTTGYRFRVHLTVVRWLYATHLLTTTGLRIKEVADRAGLGTTSAFDHEFQKRFHMTPRLLSGEEMTAQRAVLSGSGGRPAGRPFCSTDFSHCSMWWPARSRRSRCSPDYLR